MDAPPSSIAWTVERWVPGFWGAFIGAAQFAYAREPFQVTSWWRSMDRNRELGGDPDSQHLVAAAFDAYPATPQVAAALEAAGFIVVREWDHIHAQAWPAGAARRAGLLAAVGV
jgi:hypothetical protein